MPAGVQQLWEPVLCPSSHQHPQLRGHFNRERRLSEPGDKCEPRQDPQRTGEAHALLPLPMDVTHASGVTGVQQCAARNQVTHSQVLFMAHALPQVCQFNNASCGVFQALAQRGYLTAIIKNTGSLATSFTISVRYPLPTHT